MDFEYNFQWEFLKSLNPQSRVVRDGIVSSIKPSVFEKELKGGALTPAELEIRLKNPNSTESLTLMNAAIIEFAKQQQNLLLLIPEKVIEESINVQSIPPVEWSDQKIAQILPDPYELKNENEELAKKLKEALEYLHKLQNEHDEINKEIHQREEDLTSEYNQAYPNNVYLMTVEKQQNIRASYSRIDTNAPQAKKMHEASKKAYEQSAGIPPPPPLPSNPAEREKIKKQEEIRDKTHVEAQKKIEFYGILTKSNDNANLKPSEIKRLEKEKNAITQKTQFDQSLTMAYDQQHANLCEQEKVKAQQVAQQQKVVNETTAKLHESNQTTKAVNDPNTLAEKDPKKLKENVKTLEKAAAKGKSPSEALKAFNAILTEKANFVIGEIKNAAANFCKKVKNFFSKKNDRNLEMDSTHKNTPSLGK